jgi:hypothetical protein
MLYHANARGRFRHSILNVDPAQVREDEAREAERERMDRLAEELSRSFAGHGTDPAYVALLDTVAADHHRPADGRGFAPLAWFRRFFH